MKIDFEETINIGYMNVSLDLDPHDFLDCDTLADLYYDVKEYYYGNPQDEYSLGDVHIEDSDLKCELPDEFIKEWQKLKTDGNSE